MIGIFKQKSSVNALLLLLYGLVLKFPIFLHPVTPSQNDGNSYIYYLILGLLKQVAEDAPIVYSILAFLLVFTQATLLNRIVNSIKLFPKPNYLVGMSFLLVTSLMKEWPYFSSTLLINSLMIWTWYRMIGLYNNPNPKTSIFNVSVLVGLMPLIYSPTIAFLLLLFLSLIITRPPRLAEWLVAVMGILTPYYFLFTILYLTTKLDFSKIISSVDFYLPKIPDSIWITAGIILLMLPFLLGGYYVQRHLNKMLIHIRKAWTLFFLFLLVALLIILISPGDDYLHWMLVAIPITAFHGAAYFYLNSRWLALALHWISFIYIILLNYEVFN